MRRRGTLVLTTMLAAGLASGAGPASGAASKTGKSRTTGKAITAGPSDYGRMLFDAKGQAIYAFERDTKRKSNCYGACAKAWPPVLTKNRPRAKGGVKASLLGTIKRKDGKRQVTYAGKPLYFYAHEDAGEVLCHNVFLNGGLWWVLGTNGKPRP